MGETDKEKRREKRRKKIEGDHGDHGESWRARERRVVGQEAVMLHRTAVRERGDFCMAMAQLSVDP